MCRLMTLELLHVIRDYTLTRTYGINALIRYEVNQSDYNNQ